VPASDYNQQLALYRAGQVDALWQFMAIPSPSIEAAQASRPLRALPLAAALCEQLADLGWAATELPAGAYGLDDRPTPTVVMDTSLGFHAAVDPNVVAAIVGAICDHPAAVRTIHPAAAEFDPSRACLNPGGPLHPGAQRYYDSNRFLGTT
jgi:TRAP transporter TAXI family solute receptor